MVLWLIIHIYLKMNAVDEKYMFTSHINWGTTCGNNVSLTVVILLLSLFIGSVVRNT